MTVRLSVAYVRGVLLVARLAVALTLAVPSAGFAASFLYLASEGPSEPVAIGRRLRLSAAESSLSAYATDGGGLYVSAEEPDLGWRYFLHFNPPAGQQFTPGSYDGASDCGFSSKAGVCVQREWYGYPVTGHIEVLEAAYDASGHLVRFAASFSQEGATPGTQLTGAIRFASGAAECAGAPDGTACDDLDACSSASACAGGVCEPTATTACPGPAGDACHDVPACDPDTGACHTSPEWRNGNRCDTGDACVGIAYCEDGVCTPWSYSYCSDSEECTYDTCTSDAGCSYPPIPGACGRPGLPGSYVFIRRTPGGGPGDPFPVLLVPGFGTYTGTDTNGAVSFSGTDDDPNHYSSVSIAPPPGTKLAAGTYENAAPEAYLQGETRALLSIYATSLTTCYEAVGRIVVHEVSTRFIEGDRGQAFTLSADFEQRCPDGTTISGVVRIRSGDSSCVDASDGAPCDDLNACTATSSCQSGFCRGADPVVCPPAAACHSASLCDPATGACVDAPPVGDGVFCNDPTTCTPAGTCRNGTCVAEEERCDDGNPCTRDICPAAACEHDLIPGCWLVASQTRLVASASGTLRGQDVECGPLRCQRSGRSILLLPDDGTYRIPTGTITCSDGDTRRMPDEVGTVRSGRSGKLRLRPTNMADIRQALRECRRRRIDVANRQWIRISADGQELTGVGRARVTIFDQIPLHQSLVSRLRGRLGAPPDPIVPPPNARTCPDQLVLQCRAD